MPSCSKRCTPDHILHIKRALEHHWRTAKTQIRIHRLITVYTFHLNKVWLIYWSHLAKTYLQAYADSEVWSEPSLSSNRSIGHYKMYEWRAKARMILCACAGWSESADFVHVRRHFFAWWCPYNILTRSDSPDATARRRMKVRAFGTHICTAGRFASWVNDWLYEKRRNCRPGYWPHSYNALCDLTLIWTSWQPTVRVLLPWATYLTYISSDCRMPQKALIFDILFDIRSCYLNLIHSVEKKVVWTLRLRPEPGSSGAMNFHS